MVIEFLYPELGDLFGERGQMAFLKKLFPEAIFLSTQLMQEPYFARHPIDLLYLGPSSEPNQERILARLLPYAERLGELIKADVPMFFIGNALEILGRYIETDEGRRVNALGLYPYHAKRQMMKRINCLYSGNLVSGLFEADSAQTTGEKMPEILGFKSTFTQCFDADPQQAFLHNIRGFGMNLEAPFEGVADHRLIGTYLIGPLLILNPDFTRLWLRKAGFAGRELPFANTLDKAYERRRLEFANPKTFTYVR